jgi:hypothetical protein
MRISRLKIETILIKEALKVHGRLSKTDPLEQGYPLLYMTARHDGIELLDALVAARESALMTILLLRALATAGDIDVVREVIDHFDRLNAIDNSYAVGRDFFRIWLSKQVAA